MFRFRLFACFIIAMAAFVAGTAQAGPQPNEIEKYSGIAPHKALYTIRLAGIKSGSQVINISGQMLYEWQPSCDGWLSNHKFNLLYEYADSDPMRIASDFSTFEAFDGKSLDFTSQRKRDGQVFEEFRGKASLDNNGKGEASYTIPEGLSIDLPTGSVFPMMHTVDVLNALHAHKKFFKTTVFDGADDEGPVEINAFIGKPIDPSEIIKPTKDLDAGLLKSPAHKIRLAFFPLKDNDASTSDYEMTLNLHENGVVSDMYIEYDDFSITQKLVALEPIKSTCSGENGKE